jgi:hypothetical protein
VAPRLLACASRLFAVCALSLLLASIAGCASPRPLPINVNAVWATRTLDHGEVTLSVPSDWDVGEAWTKPSSFTDLIGSFSNESLSPPCTTGPDTIGCGPPLQSLQAGTLLVEVFHDGSPDFTLDSEPGTPTTVSGLPARMTDASGSVGPCNGLGADQTRTEVIPFPSAPDNWIEIDVCSRSVDEAVGARIMASVAVSLPG